MKEVISYSIPTFNVITVKLRHVVIREGEDVKHYDAYLHVPPTAQCLVPELPTTIHVLESCNVKVSSHCGFRILFKGCPGGGGGGGGGGQGRKAWR